MGDTEATTDAAAEARPGLGDSLRLLRAGLHASAQGTLDSGRALAELLLADLALARAAALRGLLCAGIALVLGGSAWLLLMAVLVASLQATGLGWSGALLLAAVLSLAGAALAGWLATGYLRHTALHASRRQWAQLLAQPTPTTDTEPDA